MFPNVTTSDNQIFNNLWSNTNTYTLDYWPSAAGTNTITAGSLTVTVVVVQLTGLSYSPNPVAVSSNVTLTVSLFPTNATPPTTLEWSTNVTGSGTSASQTWTNWNIYPVDVWAPFWGVGGQVDVVVYAVDDIRAESTALCCGASGGTNTFYSRIQPAIGDLASVGSNLVFWTGGPLTGTNTGENISIPFTNLGLSIITVTCGSSFTNFTNVLVRVEIDPLRKTNYFAYGGTNSVTLTLTNSYGEVDWEVGSLNYTNKTTNSITILSGGTGPDEYTVTATSRDTGTCVDTAKIVIVEAAFGPNPLVLPVGSTAERG